MGQLAELELFVHEHDLIVKDGVDYLPRVAGNRESEQKSIHRGNPAGQEGGMCPQGRQATGRDTDSSAGAASAL